MSPPESDTARWFAEEIQPHEQALRAYLQRHFPKLSGQLDDLVQEAYARVLRARQTGKLVEPRAYLFIIARNAALDFFRRNRIVSIGGLGEVERLNVVEERPDAAEAASQEQEIAILSEAIQALPPRCREIFTLRRFHGLSHQEIGRRLGIAPATVNAQLAIAMLRCRAFLNARGLLSRNHHAAPSPRS